MNKVILLGRLTKDPDIRGDGESKVAKYTLAVDRRFSKSEENKTDFIGITVFAKGADFAEKYLKKGIKVLVTGRIQSGSYTNKDNQKVYTTDVIAEDQEFAESKKDRGDESQDTGSDNKDSDFMDIPSEQKDDMPF